MTGSFLARHRTICSVLVEIRDMAHNRKDAHTIALCEEAITYAQRMSSKLVEYKQTTNELRRMAALFKRYML